MIKKEDFKEVYDIVTNEIFDILGPTSHEERKIIEMVVCVTLRTYQLINERSVNKTKKKKRE